MELDTFTYYFVITKTLNLSNVKYKLAHLNKYSPIKRHQRIYATTISILYNMAENIVAVLCIYGALAILLLFVITKAMNTRHVKWNMMYINQY